MRKSFIRGSGVVAAAVAGMLVSGSTASAIPLAAKTPLQKVRADVQKQQHTYVSCLVKAQTNCEKTGMSVQTECNLSTGGITPGSGADAKGKFMSDIAKCDAKLNFLKQVKAPLTDESAYDGIGCPGDSNSGTAGDQPYNLLSELEEGTPPATKAQIKTLADALGAFSECGSQTLPKDQQKCQADVNKRVAGYAAAIQKCQLGCETDYAGKKGDGGDTESTTACSLNSAGTSGAEANPFGVCIDKAYAKATKKPLPPLVVSIVLPALSTALNDANNDMNNEDDCP